MFLRCPKCSEPSRVVAEEAGAAGQMAHCTRCGTVWLARHFPFDAFHSGHPSRHVAVPRQPLIIEGEVVRPARWPSPVPRSPAPVRNGTRSWAGTHSRPSNRGLVALAAGIGFAALLALAVLITTAMPGIAGLFEGEGGLVLQNIKSSTVTLNGTDTITVEGEIANHERTELTIPAIRISLATDADVEAYSWLVEPLASKLAAGETVGFRSALVNPVPGAGRVSVSFAPHDQQIGLR